MSIPVIILNLDRTPTRKEIMKEKLRKSGVENYYFFPAYDGRYITNLSFYANIGIGYGAGRAFQKAELGIIMTHLAAWKFSRMMDFDEVIILEDDVAICSDWNERLILLKDKLPVNWEYVYLSGHSDYIKFQKMDSPEIIPAPKMVGAFSYMIKGTALQKMEKHCTSFMTTIDDMIMNMIQEKKLNGHVYFPFMTHHDSKESLIWGTTAKEHSSKLFFKDKIE